MILLFCFQGSSLFPKSMSVFFIEEWIQRWSQIAEHGGGRLQANGAKYTEIGQLTRTKK